MTIKMRPLSLLTAACLSLTALADDASPTINAEVSLPSPAAHACYEEGKGSWMLGMGYLEHSPVAYLGKVVLPRLVTTEDGRKRAVVQLQALQDGKLKTAEEVGAADYVSCASANSLPAIPQLKLETCFQEMRITLAMLDSKLRGMTEAQAVEDYRKRTPDITIMALDTAARRAHDVYSVVKKGEEQPFMEAVFGVCSGG
jgi:hypothetical protein